MKTLEMLDESQGFSFARSIKKLLQRDGLN